MISIKKGLDLPIAGKPVQSLGDTKSPRTVAVLGPDYVGMKPTMAVREGEAVKLGQVLFSDKKTPGVVFTAPASGTVSAINRGAKRVLESVVIDVDASSDDAERFDTSSATDRAGVESVLVASGLWTAFRTRPFSRVPELGSAPHSIFVTAMDTNPLAADPLVIINDRPDDFTAGLDGIARLTEGKVFVCHEAGKFVPAGSDPKLTPSEFGGIHPAGLAGTHIHHLDPVSAKKTVWSIGYQDVIAIGHLLQSGTLDSSRVISLAGPGVSSPRLIRTTLGASIEELAAGELNEGEQRLISGPVFSGHTARGGLAFLGRYHQQISVLPEERERHFLGYLTPGGNRHSVFPVFLSSWLKKKSVDLTTTTNGSTRAMVPIGTYDSVMPGDFLATQLMRSLLVADVERAINLGCLELDEDDVALCTYACPGKYEYGPVLRQMLNQIQKEG